MTHVWTHTQTHLRPFPLPTGRHNTPSQAIRVQSPVFAPAAITGQYPHCGITLNRLGDSAMRISVTRPLLLLSQIFQSGGWRRRACDGAESRTLKTRRTAPAYLATTGDGTEKPSLVWYEAEPNISVGILHSGIEVQRPFYRR